MKLEALQFLSSPEGEKILGEYENVAAQDLPALTIFLSKKKLPFASETTTLLKLRKSAAGKFSRAKAMLFTTDGLEQASGEKISRYIAQRFKAVIEHGPVSDLTGGIGGNSIFLAEHFPVRTVDIDETHLYCARHNARLYGNGENIELICGRAEDNIREAAAFMIDPQRIRSGKTKTRSLHNSQPDITSLLPKMLSVTENICVKISPAFDYKEIAGLPGSPGVEVVSEGDNNKAAFLWFGKFKETDRQATILDGGQPVSFRRGDAAIKYEELGKFLYLPNKAIIKARLVHEAGDQYGLAKLSDYDEFLTSDGLLNYPERVFRAFSVVDHDLFTMRSVKGIIRRNSLDRVHIVSRHNLLGADDLRKRLKLKEAGEHTLILTWISDKKYVVLAKNL